MAGKKKEKKNKKLLKSSSVEEQSSVVQNSENTESSNIDDFLGVEQTDPNDNLTEVQKVKVEKLDSIKGKISQILQSQNIEIVDENIGDEYDSDSSFGGEEQSQQDYDSLKALFGDKSKAKKQELTLTIDDFDYTYVGQYLDEYDLMHMKSIKRVKIQRKYPKWLKKFILISSIVAFLGVGVFLAIFLTREQPVYLKNVTLSLTEETYYVGQKFEYPNSGFYFIAEYSDGTKKKVNVTKNHLTDVTGRIEYVGDKKDEIQFINGPSAVLTFSYQGFNTNYTIKVEKKIADGLKAFYTDGIFELAAGGFISSSNLNLAVNYTGFGAEEIAVIGSKIRVLVDGVNCSYVSGKGFIVENGTTDASEITVVYTEDSTVLTLTFSYQAGVNEASMTKI